MLLRLICLCFWNCDLMVFLRIKILTLIGMFVFDLFMLWDFDLLVFWKLRFGQLPVYLYLIFLFFEDLAHTFHINQ